MIDENYDPVVEASVQFSNMLEEEVFFFMYHMQIPERETLAFPVYKRKWHIHRFVEQRRKENAELEKAKRAPKKGK